MTSTEFTSTKSAHSFRVVYRVEVKSGKKWTEVSTHDNASEAKAAALALAQSPGSVRVRAGMR